MYFKFLKIAIIASLLIFIYFPQSFASPNSKGYEKNYSFDELFANGCSAGYFYKQDSGGNNDESMLAAPNSPSPKDQSDEGMSYSDWAAITLACVAILVTVLGVIIAILSIWGYRNILEQVKDTADDVSSKTSSEVAKRQVEDCINGIAKDELVKLIRNGELREQLENAIDLIYRNHSDLSSFNDGFNTYPELDDEGDEK